MICLMNTQREVTDLGGTMRLGAFTARLQPGSRAASFYGAQEISERHRHRYEVNNDYRDPLREEGMLVSGTSPDGNLVEMIELPDAPLVRRHAVPPRAEVAAQPPAPALRRLRRRGGGAARAAGRGDARTARWRRAVR